MHRILTVVLLSVLMSCTAVFCAADDHSHASAQAQAHEQAALDALKQALSHLQQAAADSAHPGRKGALENVIAAIKALEEDQNRDHRASEPSRQDKNLPRNENVSK